MDLNKIQHFFYLKMGLFGMQLGIQETFTVGNVTENPLFFAVMF